MTRTERLLAVACAGIALGCQGPSHRDLAHESLHSVLWMQSAVEYRAVVAEIYGLAELRLDEALADPSWTAALEQTGRLAGLPPAVILDVDETTLDNTPFGARLIVDGRPFSGELWRQWVRQEQAVAMPGAVAFAEHARRRGVAVFFVTNRSSDLDAHTLRNLAAVGFPVDPAGGNLLSAEPAAPEPQGSRVADAAVRRALVTTDKTARRRLVAERYRVLLLVGDDLNDFVSSDALGPAERATLAREQAARWGRSWIVLPNPIYGSWLTALSGNQPLPRYEVLERLRGWLSIAK